MLCFAVAVIAGYYLRAIQHVDNFNGYAMSAYNMLHVAQARLKRLPASRLPEVSTAVYPLQTSKQPT